MRAAIMDAPHAMRVGDWTPAPLGPGEVRVAVRATGICAGDMYFFLGKNPYAVYPQVCGHEIAGVLTELGDGVNGLSVGDRVVVEPFIGCGRCYPCRVGKSNCCANLTIIGIHRPGGFGEELTAPADRIHRIPDGLSFSDASFAEPVAIGVQACRRGEVRAGETVFILGCGPIGLALIEVAQAKGAHPVVTDLNSERLETAAALGAETMPAGDDLLDRVRERTDGEGMPVVIEATGAVPAMESAVDLVAAGGRIVIVGLVKQGLGVTFPGLDFTRKEMTVVGSRASVNCFPESLELLAKGAIHYPRYATEFSMWDAPRVFTEWAERPGMIHKGVLIP